MLDDRFRSDREIWCHALFLHGVYKAHNALRRGGLCAEPLTMVWAQIRSIATQHRVLSGLIR